MANEKIINSRIQNKVDTEANWTTAGRNGFIPKNGEFIIYKEDEAHPLRRVKIGDHTTPVHKLPFITGDNPDINMEKGTGEGAIQQVADDATFTVQNQYINSDSNVAKDASGNITTGALGAYSSELGGKSQAKGKRALAEGTSTVALGNYSHAEGNATFAKGVNSHAEGQMTAAIGDSSHTEGSKTASIGVNSHAEGFETKANAYASHVEGGYTSSDSDYQHVQGIRNIPDATGRYAHIVGNGREGTPANAHTLDWWGNGWYQGDVRVGGTSYDDAQLLATENYVDNQFEASPITFYSTEEIVGTTSTWSGVLGKTDYISNGFSCLTISKDDGMDDQTGHVGVKIDNGVIYTDASCPWGYLGDGGIGFFRIGEINAVAGKTYAFPATSSLTTFDYSYPPYNTVYVATLDNPYNAVAIGSFVQEGEYDGFKYGHCSAFNFTPISTKTYGIYVRVEIRAHNAQDAISYNNRLLADLSSYVKSINKYATKAQLNSLDSAKLDKTSDINAVYGTDNTGAQSSIGYSVEKTPETIAKRNSDGALCVADPTQEDHAATKKYVDNAISESGAVVPDNIVTTDNLVESLETAGFMETLGLAFEEVFTSIGEAVDTKVDKTSDANKVYGTDANGNQTKVAYGYSALVNNIPLRTANGNISVPETPGSDNSAASKKYVDDSIGTVSIVTDDTVAYQKIVPAGVAGGAEVVSVENSVTAVESVGRNLLDISAALNDCLVDNGDGTYTLTNINGKRFSAQFPFTVPDGYGYAIANCSVEILDTNMNNFNRLSMRIRDAEGNQLASWGLAHGGQDYGVKSGLADIYIYNNDGNTSGDYVTFRNPTITLGKPYVGYSPYVKNTYSVRDLPVAIAVEEGGTVTFVNEAGLAVPSTINYYTNSKEDAVYSGKFVGEFVGKIGGDFASKSYVDDLAATKVTAPAPESMEQGTTYMVVTTDKGATYKAGKASVGVSANSFVKRTTTGTVKTNTPVEDTDATTKKYVDNINVVGGTGNGSVQQKTDSATFTVQNEYINTDSGVTKDASNNITTGALGDFSSELGGKSQAKGKRAHAEGTSTVALGNYSHAEGNATFAKGPNTHAEGQMTSALAQNAHAEGSKTTAHSDNAHSEGYETNAVGYASHAEGISTTAQGEGAHAEGARTEAKLNYSHAEGYDTHANGESSHAEGHGTIVGDGCHAQHVQGSYNKVDESNRYAHIVGNGSDANNPSNAHTIDWNGAGWFAGDVRVGGTSYDDAKILATNEYIDGKVTDIVNYVDDQISSVSGGGSSSSSPLKYGTTLYTTDKLSSTYDSEGFALKLFTATDGNANQYTGTLGVKISKEGAIETKYTAPSGFNNGTYAYYSISIKIGEFRAKKNKTYTLPNNLYTGNGEHGCYIYLTSSSGNVEPTTTEVEQTPYGIIMKYNDVTFTSDTDVTYNIMLSLSVKDTLIRDYVENFGVVATIPSEWFNDFDKYLPFLTYIYDKLGTPNLIFGTDASGNFTSYSVSDLAQTLLAAMPAAEEGKF